MNNPLPPVAMHVLALILCLLSLSCARDAAVPHPSEVTSDAAASKAGYSNFAAHLVFPANSVHAHAYWTGEVAVNKETSLQLEFRDAETHLITKIKDIPTVSVWNRAYSYGLVQPTVSPALDKAGKEILGTYNVSNVLFLASGQWEVRVYLTSPNGVETLQTFIADLGALAINPKDVPRSPMHDMMKGMNMNMKGMNHSMPSTNTPEQTPVAGPKAKHHSGNKHGEH